MGVFVTSLERTHGYFLRIKWVSCGLFTSILSSDNPALSGDVPKAPWEGEEVRIQLQSSDFKIFTLSTPSSLASTLISAPSSENLLLSVVFLSYSWVLATAQRSA